MTLLTHAEEAQLSQDVVATALAGALHMHGSQKAFAQRAGVTPVFVNNIIKGKRMPSLDMARRMAPLLPISPTDQAAWLEQVEHFWHSRRCIERTARALVREDALAMVQKLRDLRLSTFSAPPDGVRYAWDLTLKLGEALCPHLAVKEHAALYLDYCDVMFEAYSMLGRHVNALWIIKRKQWVAAWMEESPILRGSHLDRRSFDEHKVNALRQEMVVLSGLGLCKEAYDLAFKIEADPAYQRNAAFWQALLTWDRLHAMKRLPRVGLREARRMVYTAWRASEALGNDWQPLAHLLLARSYANFCVSRDHWQEARATLSQYLPVLNHIPYCGPLHKVLFLRAWAQTLRAQGALDEWREVIMEATHLAQQAGLANELAVIERERREGGRLGRSKRDNEPQGELVLD